MIFHHEIWHTHIKNSVTKSQSGICYPLDEACKCLHSKERKNNGFGKFLAGAALGVGLGVLFAPKSGAETRKELKQKLTDLKEKEDQLQVDADKLQDPDYIARYAREKYAYSKDGEIILRIP